LLIGQENRCAGSPASSSSIATIYPEPRPIDAIDRKLDEFFKSVTPAGGVFQISEIARQIIYLTCSRVRRLMNTA